MYDQASPIGDIYEYSGEVSFAAEAPRNFYARFGKRLFDIAFVVLASPILLLTIGLLALLVRRDGGPAFYSQPRIGRNGEVFRFYKLRSMMVDGEATLEGYLEAHPAEREIWNRTQKLENDPRVTRIGRILRKTSLDELPQFLNVLIGDMSVVGPRPFLPDQEARYRAAGGKAYYELRPGVTGLWQVGSRNKTSFEGRVAFDEAYAERIGILTDIRLIFGTFGVVLRSTGA